MMINIEAMTGQCAEKKDYKVLTPNTSTTLSPKVQVHCKKENGKPYKSQGAG